MANLELLTAAAGPIDIALAKAHGRITTASEDVLVQVYLDSVFQFVEDFTGKDIRAKTYRQTGQQLNGCTVNNSSGSVSSALVLDANQAVSVESIAYLLDGVETTISAAEYNLYQKIYQSYITPISTGSIVSEFPETDGGPNGYTVNFTTGWAGVFPSSLIGAMLNHFMFFYENRGDAIAAGATAGSGLITAPPESLKIYKQFRTTRI